MVDLQFNITPNQITTPDPKKIHVSRNIAEGSKAGSVTRGHRYFNLGATGTSTDNFQFLVPDNWDTTQNPQAWLYGFTTGTDAPGKFYRFEFGAEYTKDGEEMEDLEDETITWDETAPTGDWILLMTGKQDLNKSLIEAGDEINLIAKRIGSADDRANGFKLFAVIVEFPRTDFGVYV